MVVLELWRVLEDVWTIFRTFLEEFRPVLLHRFYDMSVIYGDYEFRTKFIRPLRINLQSTWTIILKCFGIGARSGRETNI
jgi:hypothetical protein